MCTYIVKAQRLILLTWPVGYNYGKIPYNKSRVLVLMVFLKITAIPMQKKVSYPEGDTLHIGGGGGTVDTFFDK